MAAACAVAGSVSYRPHQPIGGGAASLATGELRPCNRHAMYAGDPFIRAPRIFVWHSADRQPHWLKNAALFKQLSDKIAHALRRGCQL
jgi:hypothetical protein